MNILFIGDVVGRVGRRMLKDHLSALVEKYNVDFVIVNGENATHGKGLSRNHYFELIDAGADVIAFDGTSRDRGECTLEEIIDEIHLKNRLAMADISTIGEGLNCVKLGADIISTTLAGYTDESGIAGDTPDFELLEKLVKTVKKPVILEGRIWAPDEVKKAFELGAYCVVIGSAITRPHLVTKRFTEWNK